MKTCSVLGCSLLAFAAHAVDAPAPDPTPGDTRVYRIVDDYTQLEIGRYAMTFVQRDSLNLSYRIVDERTQVARRQDLTHQLGNCRRNTLDQIGCGSVYAFPMAIGTKSGYDRLPLTGRAGYEAQACVVEAFEKVKVPAGDFEAYRIECAGHWRFSDSDFSWSGRLLGTYWYAPGLHAPVRQFVRNHDVKGRPLNREVHELVSLSREELDSAALVYAAKPVVRVAEAMPREFSAGGTRFAGAFRAGPGGKFSGTGRIDWANGDSYEGPLVDGARSGEGRFVWANGQRYEGSWRDDRAEGRGRITFPNGNVYEGDVRSGVPEGQGTLAYPSGDVYTGDVRDGLAHGQGSLTTAAGDRYVGGWKAGQRDGRGVQTWANGDRWEGVFVDDARTDGVLTRKAVP